MKSEPFLETVYHELRKLAQRQLADERSGHTLQATALVNEAFLRIQSQTEGIDDDARRFYCAAAEAMRRILIDHARKHGAQRRGGAWQRTPLDLIEVAGSMDLEQILAVDEAIQSLSKEFERPAEIVRLRFFAGLSEPDAARALEISERTLRREWTFARAWLYRHLESPT